MRSVVDRNVVTGRISVFSVVRRGPFKMHSASEMELKRITLKY